MSNLACHIAIFTSAAAFLNHLASSTKHAIRTDVILKCAVLVWRRTLRLTSGYNNGGLTGIKMRFFFILCS